ncbi:MAG: exonuclease SbcCD subunit D [Nanoarchaeota archaeon]|nr:exonuclease SbcCD subunit D [Nanoarchaeota archaeon]
MVKFAHLSDCHLGGWRQEELQKLNFDSFCKVLETCVNEKVDFILVSGDLFDSAYPPIEILKETFAQFKKLKENNIPVFLIAGSHDFSVSGKTFLDVLEKAGFCKNVGNSDVVSDDKIVLTPTFFKEVAIYGYPGKKSGMEIEDLKKTCFQGVHPFTIFMIHTTIKDVIGTLPIEFIEKEKLPLANYYAMGHVHQVFESCQGPTHFIYPGPTFPNNFQELADLKCGSFQIVEENSGKIKYRNIKILLKDVVFLEIEIDNGPTATQLIISEIDKLNLADKIFLIKIKGTMKTGKTGDIHFNEIEDFVKKKGAYSFLRNISSVKMIEADFIETSNENVENIEKKIIGEYAVRNPADFNKFLPQLMNALSTEKNEDEKSVIFEERLMSELKACLGLSEIL